MASLQVKKPRKKRKPMTPEQRKAAAERLAAAREKRLKDNPPKNTSVHESVRSLPDDDPLSLKNVREWIKIQKDLRSSYQKQVRQKVKGAEWQHTQADTYVKNMENYLRTGEWMNLFYGEHQEHRIKHICRALAYHHTGKYAGLAKRTVGVYYPDIGCEWTVEMDRDYYK